MATDPDAALHRAKPGKFKPGAAAPADPYAAPSRDTGTLADTVERLPELRPVQATAAPIEDPATFGQVFSAARATARDDRSDFNEIKIRDGYQPIIEALGLPNSENPARFLEDRQAPYTHGVEMFGNPSQLATNAGQGQSMFGGMHLASRELQEKLIADQIKTRRLTDPKFLPGVPDTPDALRKYFLEAETKKRRSAQATLGRSEGLSGMLASLGGGVVESFHDPLNLVTLPIGGGGKTVLQTVARETIVNGLLEAMQQPIVAQNRQQFGESLSIGEAAQNTIMAGVGGGLLEGGLKVGGKGVKALAGKVKAPDALADAIFAAMPERLQKSWGDGIQRKWAERLAKGEKLEDVFSQLSNRELTALSQAVVGDGKLTPDESAAVNVLTRAQEIGETSPYERSSAGDGAHDAGLAEALKALEDGELPRDRIADPGAGRPAPEAGRSPAALSTARRPRGPAHLPADIVDGLKARGIPEHIARGAAAGISAEARGGDHTAVNPTSGAIGLGQWLGSRKAELIRRYGPNPTREQQLDFIAWELKGGDAGGAAVLAAKDEASALDAYIRKFMRPAAGAETTGDLERGMAALGGGELPDAPMGGTAAIEDPAIARLKAEALQLDDQIVGLTRRPDGSSVTAGTRSVPSSKIAIDAERFQFKSGGDQFGVTEALKGVKEWDPVMSGRVILWEDPAGALFVADGHQRAGLAKRIAAETGKDVPVDAIVLRSADGVTAEDARVMAALKNIGEGTGTAVDAAKVLRDGGPHLLERLPPRSALVRDGAALAKLSDEAFGAVYNGVVPPDFAAVIGHLLPDRPEAHGAMIDLLIKTDPANRGQAESIIRQGMAAGLHTEEQVDLFGSHDKVTSLMLERAKVLEKGLARIRRMGLVHKTAAQEKKALEAVGSTIAAERSAQEAQANAQAVEIVSRLAFSRGPVADALNAAAQKLASGGKLADVVDAFVAEVRGLDLAAVSRAAPVDAGSGVVPDGIGRGGETGEAGAAVRGEPEQPSLEELQTAAERFSDPDGKAVQQQAASLVHDLKADVAGGGTRREQILAATAKLEGVKPGEFRSVEPFPKDEPGYHRFRYVSQDGTTVGGNYTIDAGPPPFVEGFNVGDANNPVQLGPKEVRAMFDQIRAQHPDVTRIHAFRMTGARAEAGSGPKEIWIDLTGKPKQGDVAPEAVEIHGEAPPRDLSHLDALRGRLADEKARLDSAPNEQQRAHRQVFVDQIEREIAGELKFLGIEAAPNVKLSDDELLAELADAVDPAIADRQRQELALRADAPLRPGAIDAEGDMGLALFDKANQPELTFRMGEEGDEISDADLLAELEADTKAIATIKACL